jgi:HEAT repeat protein/beta-lactamase regulating signal transducer with metallopeptidase domain
MTAMIAVIESMGYEAAMWLLTYWIHSTLLLGTAWILGRWVFKGEAWRDVIWKTALVGGVVTATAAQLFSTGWAARIPLPLPSATGGEGVHLPVDDEVVTIIERATVVSEDRPAAVNDQPNAPASSSPPADPLEAAQVASGESGAAVEEAARALASTPERPFGEMPAPWMWAAAWIGVATLLLGSLALRHLRLRTALQDRRIVSNGPLAAMLAKLRRSTGVWRAVRLSATPAIATPLALGRSEICVPARFIDGLPAEEQKAALAHELGHLVRRDPLWHFTVQLLQAVFFFQPLHHVARRRLRQSAEFLADAWAVRETGSRLGLARCLAEVADWVSGEGSRDVAGSVAMAEGGSPLATRVRRLLDGDVESATTPAASWAVAAGLLLLTAGFAPAVASEARVGPVIPGVAPTPSVYYEPQDVDVVRVVTAGGTLESRAAAARGLAEGSGDLAYWLAYVVEGSVEVGEDVAEDSGPMDGGTMYGPAVEGLLDVGSEVGPAGSGDLLVLAQAAPREPTPRVVRLALRSPGLGIDLQGRTVYWLGRAQPGESLEWARGIFEDDSQELEIRAGALEIVSRHPLAGAQQILGDVASGGGAPELREEAVEGLGLHPAEGTVDLLADIAGGDPDLEIRAEAAETLGDLDSPAAAPALVALTRSTPDVEIKEEAIEALEVQADTLLPTLLLELALRDPDPQFRIEAVGMMQDLPPDVAIPLLEQTFGALPDESSAREVRLEIIEVLSEIGTPAAVEVLEIAISRALPDQSRAREVKLEVIDALGEIATPQAAEVLDLAISDSDREVALAVVDAFADMPAEIAAPRLEALARSHPYLEIREEALEQLPDLQGDVDLGDLLIDLALNSTDATVREQAVDQMEDLPVDQAVDLLGRVALESGDPETQQEAVESLAEVGSPEALELLDRVVQEATSVEVARQAVESIGEYPEDLAGPLLRRIASEHPSVDVRREALDQLGG